jgi:ELP3 family radical SAM enzyme/protein acetyltransferase
MIRSTFNTYNIKTIDDMESIQDIEDLFTKKVNEEKRTHTPPLKNDLVLLQEIIIEFCNSDDENFPIFMKKILDDKKKKTGITLHKVYKKPDLLYIYNMMVLDKLIERKEAFELHCTKGGVRENSGVLVVTLVMSPYPDRKPDDHNSKSGEFTCKFNCYYCPNYPDMPRSYIPDEPAVARAIQNEWDPIKQFMSRIITYKQTGMDCESGIKAEVILEGGTYNSYPEAYRVDFIHKIYYVANLITPKNLNLEFEGMREMYSLEEEQAINAAAFCKVVGLSIETRPDQITPKFIVELRKCGVTRVQIGVQHTDDKILRKINRECYFADTVRAMRLLKNAAFKIAIHLMPDLPGSNFEIDRMMLRLVLEHPDISFDYLKIYPTMVTDYTVIKQWYDRGRYRPYSETLMEYNLGGRIVMINPLIVLIAEFKANIPRYVRFERIIRDIPNFSNGGKEQIIFGGCKTLNLRQEIHKFMKLTGQKCYCIRCREVKDGKVSDDPILVVEKVEKHDGMEYFISYESADKSVIYGFCRLRLPYADDPELMKEEELQELSQSALIRELHVYGKMTSVGNSQKISSAQHRGLGTKLLLEAEKIAANNKFKKITVISAAGTRGYYHARGYTIAKLYQTKILITDDDKKNLFLIYIFIITILTLVTFLY